MLKGMLGAALLLAATTNASGQNADYLGLTPGVASEVSEVPSAIAAEVQLVELERWFFREDTFSARPLNTPGGMIHPGRRQGVLGFISFTPFEGSVPLYQCGTNDYRDQFTSRDPGCEGHRNATVMPIIGYIAASQIPGTAPLYRCMRGGLKPGNWADHFDTLDPNCENVRFPVNEGIIGYIWL